jgi:hypothetical protein
MDTARKEQYLRVVLVGLIRLDCDMRRSLCLCDKDIHTQKDEKDDRMSERK